MREKISFYLENLSLALIGLTLFLFPLVVSTLTTDAFSLPKQIVITFAALAVLLILGLRTLSDKIVRIRRTPFDVPVLLFLLIVFLSSVFAVNKTESLTSFATFFFPVLFFFLLINTAKTKKQSLFLISALIKGAVLLSLFFLLNFNKIYILPFDFTHSQLFTPLGSLLDQAIYLVVSFSLLLYIAYYFRKVEKIKFNSEKPLLRTVMILVFIYIVVITAALGETLYALIRLQQPLILPFQTGFQIGFAAISQDTSRAILSFLFGSGFGTFATDFSRFKQAVFNQNQVLWSLTFFKSSSFILELLATTGVLGLLSFLYLVLKIVKEKPLFIPLVLFIVLALILPFSFTTIALFFFLLGVFVSFKGVSDKDYFDIELALVTLKNGLIAVAAGDAREVRHGLSRILPFVVFVLILVIAGFLGYFSSRYIIANATFQQSLVDASKNNGSQAYAKQSQALSLVNYNDAYHRVFSQTNLALANSLSNSIPKGSSPSAQTTQTITTLIQQSINSARLATSLSPLSAINWQNLSAVYRGLIGFGQNADSFAILSSQQAIALDSTNPQEYLNLGGLYFQLKLWDKAIEQFTIAANLKPDFANAYYNLAHTMQQKGDLKSALSMLEQVKILVKNDPKNVKQIDDEIAALKKGIAAPTTAPEAPTTALPVQNPPVTIPAPTTPKPTPTPTPTSVPAVSPTPLK